MIRSTVNSSRRKVTAPAPAKPEPPPLPPLSQKPRNYHLTPKVSSVTTTTAAATLRYASGVSKALKHRRKPEWDPFFWKSESQLEGIKQSTPTPDATVVNNFTQVLQNPVQTGVRQTDSGIRFQGIQESSSVNDPVKPIRNNYHQWWQNLTSGTNRLGSGDISSALPKTVTIPPSTPLNDDTDPFVLDLADMSELVEFLLYKCSADECLPMLPEVLQDLDSQFRSLVTKYLENKMDVNDAEGSAQQELKAKNDDLLKSNQALVAQLENLKSQVNLFQDLMAKQEVTVTELRSKVSALESVKAEEPPPPPPVTFDLIELKAENETLKLIITKLRNESELNSRILGILELNTLCQNYREQHEVKDYKDGSKVESSSPGTK